MVTEGCVFYATAEPLGTAVDVAPEGFAHPVYRSGIGACDRYARDAVPSGRGTRGGGTWLRGSKHHAPFEEPAAVETTAIEPEPEPQVASERWNRNQPTQEPPAAEETDHEI